MLETLMEEATIVEMNKVEPFTSDVVKVLLRRVEVVMLDRTVRMEPLMELPSSVLAVNPDVANVEVTAIPGPLKVEKK